MDLAQPCPWRCGDLGAGQLERLGRAVDCEVAVGDRGETLLNGGVAVVSTCEEMAYPWWTQPEASARLDEAGKAGGVACLGTGINPGFVLDLLPVLVSAPLDRVESAGTSAWVSSKAPVLRSFSRRRPAS